MLDIAQGALQNDLFVAAGIGFFLNLPFVRPYWEPTTSSNSLPEQPHITPRSETPVTQTVTVVPEPITLSQTQTVYDTVTKNVTSISTVVKQVVTKWRLPTDPTAPRGTFIEYSEACTLPTQTCAPCPPCAPLPSSKAACQIISSCLEASCASCATLPSAESVSPTISTSPAVWIAWFLLSLVVLILGVIFLISRLDLISKRVAKAEGKAKNVRLALEVEKKFHQEWKAKAGNYSAALETYEQEVQDLLEGVARRNDMLKLLGVFPDGDHFADEESLYQKVRARKAYLTINAEHIRRMEVENTAQCKKIKELEAEITSAKEHAKNLRSETSKPDKFQELLNEKQREIKRWRNAIVDNDVKELHQLCEEKDAELEKLRLLPAEINKREQALSDASKQIETLHQEKKDQHIADRRRWIEEKNNLHEKHAEATERQAKAIKALKADLKEAQQSLKSSKSVPTKRVTKTQPKDGEGAAANKQLLVGLEAEQNTLATETMSIRSQHAMNERLSNILQALKKAVKERDQYKVALNDLKSNSGAENKQLLEAEKEAVAMEKINLWQEMSEKCSKVVRESERIKEERDELKEDFHNLKDDCYELDQDFEELECEDAVENMQRYSDLRADHNAVAMETMTLRQQIYDMKDVSSEASQNPQKVEEEDDEL